MFTVFDDELDAFARKAVDQQRSFREGEWGLDSLRNHQWHGLRDTLRYVKDNSKFYSERLAQLSPAAIELMEADEFARSVPFTTKQDLQDFPDSVLSKPLSQSWVYYETTGTTGSATPC